MSRSTLTMVSALLALASVAQAREFVIAVSPFQSPEQSKSQATQVLEFLVTLEPGDSATLLDGYELKTLGQFVIPTNAAYSAPRARLAANRPAVASFMAFAARATPPVAAQAPRVPGALRLPQLLEFIASTLTPQAGTDILVLGSPIYDAPNDAAFSMVDERFPSDAHLQSSRSETIYGTRECPQSLRGLRVHVAYEATPSLRTEQYRHAVQRFWTLYVEQQLGGAMVTFTEDLPSVFRRVIGNAAAPVHNFKRNDSHRVEMIRLIPPQNGSTIYDRPLSDRPLEPNDIQRAEHLEIGLSWNCGCDLDLYAQAHTGARPLFFARMDTPEGSYGKDFRNSPQSSGGFETITFTTPVDLRALTVLVNFYGGSAPSGLRAELRVSVNGQTFAGTIEFAPGAGNAGADAGDALARGRETASSRIVDVLAIVNSVRSL